MQTCWWIGMGDVMVDGLGGVVLGVDGRVGGLVGRDRGELRGSEEHYSSDMVRFSSDRSVRRWVGYEGGMWLGDGGACSWGGDGLTGWVARG